MKEEINFPTKPFKSNDASKTLGVANGHGGIRYLI
jgi:hypothetical protein